MKKGTFSKGCKKCTFKCKKKNNTLQKVPKFGSISCTRFKDEFKWIIGLNTKLKTIIFFFTRKQNFHDLGVGRDVLDISPKARATKANLINWT